MFSMIHPPQPNTEERYEYDILDLELLGQIATDLNIHSHPKIRQLFTTLFHKAGNRGFSEDCCALYKLLAGIQSQMFLRKNCFDQAGPNFPASEYFH